MRLFEVMIADEAKRMLFDYANEVAKVDFNVLMPALEKHFPKAIYTGEMSRAKDFDIDGKPPELQRGRYYSWAKSDQGLDAAIEDMYSGWAETLAIYVQTAKGIDVNAILGKHDHFNEEEVIARADNGKLDEFRHDDTGFGSDEGWPDIDMLRREIGKQ